MLTKTFLPQSVAREIQEMIQSGALKPGEKIPSQREFSQKFGVSRASLREALLTLETLGLIKTEAGRGTFVTDPSNVTKPGMAPWRYSDSYSVFDVFQTRIMLEGQITELASGRLTANQLDHMEQATKQMEDCWANQDLIANVEADLSFHDTIVAACSNAMLRALYQNVRDQLTETQRQPIPITDPERMKASIAEHRRIIAALRDNDGPLARREMETHIRNTARCAGLQP
ncbi:MULTISPECIES: FadR/GntR family transcriptional regulator [Thalassospira]|jgi:GntR family transcriptional repressor for pyruvate dehydrogenase complex|uniref:GntR family transcriptional regulator n=1 Tax=Thalassospira xiamenensis TaxID=220697 RepID=A0ABR5Y8W2_9PROT|nr:MULTISPECIES: FadR/GntR family transcriptional regulator [Thalassospira]MAL28186.1 FadR family transcriptional regulator [Thalassospira sp.]MBR9782207.1 FadR family transcriptional regulator [Rhodospirillales bacterium]KZD06830.1 GntR family transcriptional regulator [Thalassospira xiamenensis]KZD09119.1 GntR family transcriptional regulator [Thalassospira xiamenensis]MBL4842013.1 FadR family transcriptional regulator [Thalassospira sp.]|tara:strand:- start:1961 stop:2650 length:690 start_codon:yes stop_codon:yes gene_type:complete